MRLLLTNGLNGFYRPQIYMANRQIEQLAKIYKLNAIWMKIYLKTDLMNWLKKKQVIGSEYSYVCLNILPSTSKTFTLKDPYRLIYENCEFTFTLANS